MKEVWKALVTLLCALLSMAFIFACAVSFVMLMVGVSNNDGSAIGKSFLCLLGFGWGAARHFRMFVLRVAEDAESVEDNDEEDEAGD